MRLYTLTCPKLVLSFQVKLYVDGQRIQSDKDIVEIVDDWALHPTNKVTFNQLSVGACWKGKINLSLTINLIIIDGADRKDGCAEVYNTASEAYSVT